MAISLSNFALCASALLAGSQIGRALAATVTLDWNVTWVYANPDNLAMRPVMGINGQWPLPQLNVTRGDRIVVNLNNQLGNASTSLHFHGLFQNGTNEMDGPVGVTQCDIPPNHTFVYNFTVDQPGTYWYHSHSRAQYPDGLRGQFLVTDPENPYLGQYDKEVAFTLSDWYHDLTPNLMASFVSYKNPTGAEPIPNSALMNDTQNFTVPIEPGKTYYFRMTNIGAFAGQYFWIEGHNMTIIEVDGVYTKPQEASMIYITAAQRYGFLLTARNDSSANFAMMGSMDTSLFDTIPDGLNWNVTGWLMYDSLAPKLPAAELDEFNPFDDFTLEAYDGEEIFDHVDYSFSLDLTMQDLGDGANYAFFNDITYVTPKVPTLYSAVTTGANASDPTVYGGYTNTFILEQNEIVEIVMNNDDTGKHPFHLHGHNFQAVVRSDANGGHYDPTNQTFFPQVPMRRDTFMVNPLGHFVIRFRADNPGVWLFHCHIEWHIATGLVATMVEAPLVIQEKIPSIPQNHIDTCIGGGNLYQGNAAGNIEDVFDLDGQNEDVPPLPAGFTARGVVALVFSCLSAFLGLAVIAWYGAAPISETEMAQTRRLVAVAGGDDSK